MVRRGGRYRTQAQRDHRGRRGAGETRRETRGRRLREQRADRRARGRVLVEGRPGLAEHASGDRDTPVYGVYRDGGEWVLAGLAVAEYRLTIPEGRREDVARTVPIGGGEGVAPAAGVELARVGTKAAALEEVGAASSECVAAGRYLVRQSHDPGRVQTEADREAVRAYQRRRDTRRVRVD